MMGLTKLPQLKSHEKDIFYILKTKSLSVFYKALSSVEVEKLNNDQIYQLKKSFKKVIIQTESYICAMTVDDKDTVKRMKSNWEMFMKNIIPKWDDEWENIKNELSQLWSIFDRMFCQTKHVEEKNEEDKINAVVQWFTDNPVELFCYKAATKEKYLSDIREALKKSGLTSTLLENMPKFIYETIEILNRFHRNQNWLKWKKKLYIYDKKGEDVCYVAFYLNDKSTGTYYIDQYGNFYLKEINLLETLRKFNGCYNFTAPVENRYDDMDEHSNVVGTIVNVFNSNSSINTLSDDFGSPATSGCSSYGGYCGSDYDVRHLDDECFLEMFLQSFESIHQEEAFYHFKNQNKGKEKNSVDCLKKLKIIFPFFCQLNQVFYYFFRTSSECRNSRGFKFFWCSKGSEKILVIRIKSFHHVVDDNGLIMIFDNFKKYYYFPNYPYYNTFYMDTVLCIMAPHGAMPYPLHLIQYQNKIINIFKEEKVDFVNFYHYVAVEIIDFFKAVVDNDPKCRKVYFSTPFRSLKLEELRFLVLWIALKFKRFNHTKLNIYDAIQYYEKEEESIKNQIFRLIKIVAERRHQFSSNYAAVYYFCKNYNSIKYTLEKYVDDDEFMEDFGSIKSIPEFNELNEKKCAHFFFEEVPNVIFTEKNCMEFSKNFPTKTYEKYSIVGIRYIFGNGKTVMSNLYSRR